MATEKITNRLINENSPYLLQHANNPVDWYPWGEEAFNKAKDDDKPIFLSIGYSTCHWCHVMAHESFEDEEVAEAMNRDFVAVKVDKEERPDVDSVYMSVCQGLTGSGGWPLTIIMTPDQKPFFAGTYFPKSKRYNVPGLLEILDSVTKEWKENREELANAGDKIASLLAERAHKPGQQQAGEQGNGARLSKQIIEDAKEILYQGFDNWYGGFGSSPKFPSPHNLMFLLRYHKFEKDDHALEIVEKTLQQMYRGGIFDHIGYGFSRYSTDDKWLVPHFEKMLYDNALLTMVYLETFQITKNELYKTVAAKILSYIAREMTDEEEGGFYSAQDADSEGEEGKYYVFTPKEILDLLGEEDGERFNQFYDITDLGNFEGTNIPNLIKTRDYDPIPDEIRDRIAGVYEYRLGRTKLHKDDKRLTSWNSLMIAAYAKAYKALNDGNGNYLWPAERACVFLTDIMTGEDGKLRVSRRDGTTSGTGTLDDYSFAIWALLELYEATLEAKYLERARSLCDVMRSCFWDEENGGFFLTDRDSEQLIFRPKETYDGAMPSGNSAAGYVLIKMWKLTGIDEYHELGRKQLSFLAEHAGAYPAGYCFAMMAIMMELYQESFLCENGVCS